MDFSILAITAIKIKLEKIKISKNGSDFYFRTSFRLAGEVLR